MNNSRIVNSFKNIMTGTISQIINLFLNFGTRTVFVKYLGVEYLGVNGLFTNILTILSLAELGFGGAMVYSMYKPLAESDYRTVSKLMNFYCKIYTKIGVFIGVLGISLMPILKYIVKQENEMGNFKCIYLLFLMNSVISYFWAYKRSIITANQQEYILSQYKLYFTFVKSILQIMLLLLTKNFLIYLTIQILSTFVENLLVSKKADKMYTFLKENKNQKLDKKERKEIWKNVKALMIYKLGSTILDGTDNIIISAFIGVIWVGKLSNYTLIIGSISMLISQFTNSITASIGNFVAKESKERQEFLLKVITLIYFIIYGISTICLYFLINPFIELWLGSNYLLSENIVYVICLNWYIYGMMSSIWTFRGTMGLFIYGKYRPAISAGINLTVSIILAKNIGFIGVLLGTTVTRILTNVWYDPLIVYKHGLNRSVKYFYLIWLKYFVLLKLVMIILIILFKYIPEYNNWSIIFIKLLTSIFVSSVIIFIFIKKMEEFKYLCNIINEKIINKYKKKIRNEI